MPFLTDIDSRASIKGSRDPLGAQAIWTLLGRHVVGGLTTNTTSVRDFVVLLIGHWFIEKLDEAGSREEALPVFIRWEQFASYARLKAGDAGFRVTSRIVVGRRVSFHGEGHRPWASRAVGPARSRNVSRSGGAKANRGMRDSGGGSAGKPTNRLDGKAAETVA